MRYCLCVVVLMLVSTTRLASAAPGEPKLGELLLAADPAKLSLAGSGVKQAEAGIVSVTGAPFEKAWRVRVKEKVNGDYNLQLVAAVPAELKQGDLVLFSAYARMLATADESGEGRVSFVLEQAKDPYSKTFSAGFGVSGDWKRFDVPAVVTQDFSKTGAHVTIRLGQYVQTLEVGGVELRKMPAGTRIGELPRTLITYPGREPNAPWRAEAAARIEKIRKGDLTVLVTDAAGAPLAGAAIEVRETRGAFPFGSCYSPSRFTPDATDADSVKYRETFLSNFDTGVDEYAMKWPGWIEPATRERAMTSLKWMDDHGIRVRGHTLVWPGWSRMPASVKAAATDPAGLTQMIRDHITEEVSTLRGRVIDWDVVNEPYVNNELQKILGEKAMAQWFKWAHEADPAAQLYLNETSVPTAGPGDEHYTALYNRVKLIQDNGGPIHGVGMQAHFGMNVVAPSDLIKVFDRFQTLGVPIRITEFDLDTNDEELQAAYFHDFLTVCFSHPEVNGFLMWGFWENAHWKPNAAMYRRDWSERKTAAIWRDLTQKQWKTNTTGVTDVRGKFEVRGFLGDYEVTVTAGGKVLKQPALLSSAGTELRIIVK